MAWRLRPIDLRGASLGELRNVRNRRLSFALNRGPTVGGEIDPRNPLAAYVRLDDKTVVRAYEDSISKLVPQFVGPVVSHSKIYQGDERSLGFVAAGPQWRLGKRLIGKSQQGYSDGTALAPKDRATLIYNVLAAVNADRDTGVRQGASSASSSTYLSVQQFKHALAAIQDLAATLDGPDWEVAPVEPYTDASGLVLGLLNVQPAIGQRRADVVFEFGTGRRNVEAWSELGDADALCNSAWSLPSGFPQNSSEAPINQQNAGSIADRGLYEDVISGDVQTAALRSLLAGAHAQVRGVPKLAYTVQPVKDLDPYAAPVDKRRVPRFLVDYAIGDTVRFRAVERVETRDSAGKVTGYQEVKSVDGWVRVFKVDLALDDQGAATATLTLMEDLG